MPAVSVVIPAYNHAAFLPGTLASVFGQTFTDVEVIVVNDGSPDDTAAVVKPYADAGRVRYVEQPNAGQAAARNRGVALAAGEFVALLDDDDTWPADKLAWQVNVLRSTPDAELVGGRVTRDPGPTDVTVEAGPRRPISGIDVFWGCPFTSPGQTLIRTAAIRAVGGFDEAIRGVDDFDLYVRLARRKPLLLVDRLALHYREHPANASRDRWGMLHAADVCLRRRLPEVPLKDRWAASRRAYRGLYDMAGRDLVATLGRGGTGRFLRAFWPGLATDPKLVARVALDRLRGGTP